MRNRLAVLLPLLLLLGLLALATGCKRTDLTATGPGTEASSETAQILSALQKYQEATGNDLRNLVSEIKRQQSAQAEKAGDPPVARELKVSMSALVGAKQALEAMEKIAKRNLPQGTNFEWTGMAYQEKLVGGQVYMVFAMAVLMVVLILAALIIMLAGGRKRKAKTKPMFADSESEYP